MTTYTDVFSNTPASSSSESFKSHTLTVNTTFSWPYGYTGSGSVISRIMEVTCSAAVVMTLPSATEVSPGEDIIIRNIGSNTLTIKDSAGGAVGTVAAGAVLYVYVVTNTTAAGTWGKVTFGTGTSSADAATLAGSGILAIAATLNQQLTVVTSAVNFTVDTTYRAKLVNYTGGLGTATISLASTLLDGFFFLLKNSGTGTLTITPTSPNMIDGAATLILQPGESTIVGCSGAALFTVGLGRSTQYQFTQLTKDLSGLTTYTLTTIEAANKLLTFTGGPTVDLPVIVPAVVAVYYVYNNLSTAKVITVKTATGTGATISQSGRAIVFCDGTNVFAAQTVAVTSALSMQDGTVTNPALYFTSETNTGVYRPTVNQYGIAVNGAMSAIFGASGLITAANGNLTSVTLNAALAELQTDIDSRVTSATLTTHTGATTAHGVAGAVVGTTDAQTLTNKTLTTPVINGLPTGTGIATANTASTVVSRDASGNFSAGVITASLSGNASTVTTNANLTGGVTSVGNAATVITNANLTGDVTSVGNATTLTNAPVIAKVLTGYVSGAGTVAATDSILQAIQKLNGNKATNANLTGHVTSVGNAAVLGSFTLAQLNTAVSDDNVASDTATTSALAGKAALAGSSTQDFAAKNLQVTSINGGQLAGHRNRIINGDMRIDQRNGGAAVTVGATPAIYAVDRFYSLNDTLTGTITAQQSTLGNSKSVKVTATAAVTDLTTTKHVRGLIQVFEGQNVFDLNGKTVTVSFKVETNWTGNLAVAFRNTVANRSYVVDVPVVSGTNNVSFTLTLEATTATNNNNTRGFDILIGVNNEATYRTATTGSWLAGEFMVSTASTQWAKTLNNFINITDVQLEEGSIATPFEHRSVGAELALCQRYYEKQILSMRWDASAINSILTSTVFYVEKRAVPTCTVGTPRSSNLVSSLLAQAADLNIQSARVDLVASAAGDCQALGTPVILSAEL